MRRIEVLEEDAGRTVQSVVHDRLGISHAEAKGLIAAGRVRRNGRAAGAPDERVSPGDGVEVAAEPGRRYAGAARRTRAGDGFRVLHEDDDLVVVEKEAGLLTVPAAGRTGESLLERLTATYRKRGHKRPLLWVVHRIDRFTSGLVVFARSHPAYMELKRQFKERRPERVYLAVAEGRVPEESGRLEHSLAENPKSLKVHVADDPRAGRRASLRYRVRERFASATLLEVELETGRRNQIRVQLAAVGHPLLGDVAYGRPSPLLPRVALHAHRLAFDAPRGRKRLRFESPLPPDMKHLLARMEKGTATIRHP